MRKLLWVGDAGVPSGFARATHETLDVLRESWDVTVLGLNYRGDPHPHPYPIYAAQVSGDGLGVRRLIWMMDPVKPDVVVFQNDPWQIPFYTRQLDNFKEEYGNVFRVGAIAVDGKNCQGAGMNRLDFAIFWTKFGLEEAQRGGMDVAAAVVPLGVDTHLFTLGDQQEARQRRGFLPSMMESFVVGNVNRNQPRKRLDLSLQYFAEWVKDFDIKDAFLYIHAAPTGDDSFALQMLANYYGIGDKLIIMEPPAFYGIGEQEMVDTYRSFDVQISTTMGEGFGLTTFEGMACGIPQIVPDWSALGELCEGAAALIPCTTTAVAPNIQTIGGIADKENFVAMLQQLYVHPQLRADLSADALTRAREPRFRWRKVGEEFRDALDAQVGSVEVAV